jgi:hypothetical protein
MEEFMGYTENSIYDLLYTRLHCGSIRIYMVHLQQLLLEFPCVEFE